MSKDSISTNQELRPGDYLLSNNGNYKAILQDDGNLVIYMWKPTWASDTSNGFRLLLQEDNNLVLYTRESKPIWASNTCANTRSDQMRLTLTDQGALEVSKAGSVIWASKC